jgi:hypothetical protein
MHASRAVNFQKISRTKCHFGTQHLAGGHEVMRCRL